MLIHKTTWRTYLKFRHLCCVETLPFHAGPCWTNYDNSAFIGYNHTFRNNRLRFRAIPLLLKMSRRTQLLFYKENLLCLSRVMTKPEYRGQGIATELLIHTLPLTKRPLIECVTFTPSICKMLTTAGFKCLGWDPKNSYYYYLFSTQLNIEKFTADWLVKTSKRLR